MAVYLVTGCSRGLGLELATQLAQDPTVEKVVATARQMTSSLQQLQAKSNDKVISVQLDVGDADSVQRAASEVAKHVTHIDVLINNAAIINWMSDDIEKMDDLVSQFQINVVGAHSTTAAMLPLLRKGQGKKVINISTSVGSIEWSPKYMIMKVPAYKISKAALNMLTVQWAHSYKEEGFTFLTVSPGWLRTDLGTEGADLSVSDGASAVLDIIHKNGVESTGKFLNIHVAGWEKTDGLNQYDGAELPW